MKNYIRLEKTTSNTPSYHVYLVNTYLGDFEQDVDGFFYFMFANDNRSKGYWSSYILRIIADKLDELNKEWNEHLNKTLNEQQKKENNF